MTGIQDPRRGYALAVLNMVVSGVAIYVNSLGVRTFTDPVLYTSLKNALVGVAFLVPLAVSSRARAAYVRLTLPGVAAPARRGDHRREPLLRAVLPRAPGDDTRECLPGGPHAVPVRGMDGRSLGARSAMWAALGVLLVGLTLGIAMNAVRLDEGVLFVLAATLLFAADFVLMKFLLRSVSALTVMTFKMSVGSLFLLAFVAARGHLGTVTHLTALQWGFVAVTGLILLGFAPPPSWSSTRLGDRRHRHSTGAPIITTALVVLTQRVAIPAVRWLGLSLVLLPSSRLSSWESVTRRAGSRRAPREGPHDPPGFFSLPATHSPNRLGYCGPGDHESLLGYLTENRVDEGLARLAERFEGAYPYLRLIAAANGLADPFHPGVVEAYWVGNRLLERVGAPSLFNSLRERFRPRMDARAFSWMTALLADGTRPHHNFHVFDVYRRAGLMRDDRAPVAVERMDACPGELGTRDGRRWRGGGGPALPAGAAGWTACTRRPGARAGPAQHRRPRVPGPVPPRARPSPFTGTGYAIVLPRMPCASWRASRGGPSRTQT